MKFLVAFTILAAAKVALAIGSPNDNLMMDPTKIPSFSCSVELVDAETLQHFSSCSGSLISPNSVLTAYHCLWITQMDRANGRPIAYRVNCGSEERITDRSTAYQVNKSQNESGPAYDNMIVKLKENFLYAKPVLLPSTSKETEALRNNQKCFASGFGYGFKYNFDSDSSTKEHRGYPVSPGPGRSDRDEFSLGGLVFTRPGDSGGGTYCQNPAGNFVLVGLLRESPMDLSKPGGANFLFDSTLQWIFQNLN